MKRDPIYKPESRTIVLLTALATGLGIAVHKVFFLFAAAIALSVPFAGSLTRCAKQKRKAWLNASAPEVPSTFRR